MIVAVAILLGVVGLATVAVPLLERFTATAAPGPALAAWLASIAAVLGGTGWAVIELAWPGHSPVQRVIHSVLRCLAIAEHVMPAWAEWILAVIMTGAVAVAAARLSTVTARHVCRSLGSRRRHIDLVTTLGRPDPHVQRLVWLDHPVPLAFSIAGRRGCIVATAGLSRCLTADQQHAVLAHERAHLHRRHHLIIATCRVLAAAFPAVPLFAAAPAAVSRLVELTADRIAARRSSPAALHSALTIVATGSCSHNGAALPADDDLGTRLTRLTIPADTTTPASSLAAVIGPLVAAATPALVIICIAEAAARVYMTR